jgi:protein involved in polysaccharide export with SLBB domain
VKDSRKSTLSHLQRGKLRGRESFLRRSTDQMKRLIRVRVTGCVKRYSRDRWKVPVGATLRFAIRKAGGFRATPYPPSGVIAVRSRRKQDGKYYKRRGINFKKDQTALSVRLRDGDLIVAQYDVSSALESENKKRGQAVFSGRLASCRVHEFI